MKFICHTKLNKSNLSLFRAEHEKLIKFKFTINLNIKQ